MYPFSGWKAIKRVTKMPEKGTKYSRSGRDQNRGWMTYREIGEREGVSQVTVMNIINRGLGKIGRALFMEVHGREPTPQELNSLIKDESFQETVAELMSEGGEKKQK
jgi:hypothetical protein